MSENPIEAVIQEVDPSPVQVETPPITDIDPHSMPLADLKQAAFTPAPETTPASAWGQMTENSDGSFQVSLGTGEVFKGTAREVIAKQAEAHYNTKLWGLDWKHKYQSTQPPEVPNDPTSLQSQPEPTPEMIAAYQRQLGLEALSGALNVPVEQMPQVIREYQEAQSTYQANRVYLDFKQSCQDFVETPENVQAVMAYVPQNHFPSAEDLRVSWARAVYEGTARPYRGNEAAPPPRPPAMPSNGASMQSQEVDPWRMDKAALRKLVYGQGDNK